MTDTKHPAEVLANTCTLEAHRIGPDGWSGAAEALLQSAAMLRHIPALESERTELLQSRSAMRAQLEHVRASEANLIDQRETLRARVQELELYITGLEKDSDRVARELEAECDSLRTSTGCSEALRGLPGGGLKTERTLT